VWAARQVIFLQVDFFSNKHLTAKLNQCRPAGCWAQRKSPTKSAGLVLVELLRLSRRPSPLPPPTGKTEAEGEAGEGEDGGWFLSFSG
jgi:hypothetical protein